MNFLLDCYTDACGVDEVGCGSLFGPIVASALIIPKEYKHLFLNVRDSKELSASKRLEWYKIIISYCKYSIGIAFNYEIDEVNVRNANILACMRAAENIEDVSIKVVDGNINFKLPNYISVIKGDEKYAEIAAASIVAKVFRDTLIQFYDVLFPEYGLNQHKGYATSSHIRALQKLGATNYHRKTFLSKILNMQVT